MTDQIYKYQNTMAAGLYCAKHNQIQNVSAKIQDKNVNDDFLVNIQSSLKIMNNLTLWSNLIKR